jgi:hypothetical protein
MSAGIFSANYLAILSTFTFSPGFSLDAADGVIILLANLTAAPLNLSAEYIRVKSSRACFYKANIKPTFTSIRPGRIRASSSFSG